MKGKAPQFKCKKILEDVSDTLVNRMNLQFLDIIGTNLIRLPPDKIEKFELLLFECMKDLIMAEESKKQYLEKENDAIRTVVQPDGVTFQRHGYSFDDPTFELKKHFETFLIRCVIAIRKTVKLAEEILGVEFEGPRQLKNYLLNNLPPDSPYIKMIQEDSVWIKQLYDLRGKAEHDSLFIEDFDVLVKENQKLQIKLPYLPMVNKATLREYMDVTFENTFTYCEDIVAMLLNMKCDEKIQIVLLPENLRPKHRNFRYVVDLKPEYKKRLLKENKEKK